VQAIVGYWRKHKDRLERKARGEPPLETAKSSTPAAGSGEVTPSAPETPAAPPVDKKDREFEEEEEEEEDEDDHTHSVRRYLQKTYFQNTFCLLLDCTALLLSMIVQSCPTF
jgi:hypothetical protein